MPRFTLIKHADSQYDSDITMEFDADVLDLARAHYEDFLTASGFVTPLDEDTSFRDWNNKKEDDMWTEAVASKFSFNEIYNYSGAASADVIQFPTSDS